MSTANENEAARVALAKAHLRGAFYEIDRCLAEMSIVWGQTSPNQRSRHARALCEWVEYELWRRSGSPSTVVIPDQSSIGRIPAQARSWLVDAIENTHLGLLTAAQLRDRLGVPPAADDANAAAQSAA